MNVYNLGGHSGCEISLFEEDEGISFVRKKSKDCSYNVRLMHQCQKQEKFRSNTIRTPRVLNKGISEDGLFFFDMEYIHGVTLAEYVKTIEIGRINSLVDAILSEMVPKSSMRTAINANSEFRYKIYDLEESLDAVNNPVISQAFEKLKNHDWRAFVPSPCHGDLTLENIIVHNDELFYIDFLDSFYESWLIDAGTLLQDVQSLWSYRNDHNISMNTILRLIVFRDLLVDKVRMINSDQDYIEEMYYALLLKLIRIYPYTTERQTHEYLNMKTESVIKIIEGFNS